MRIQRNIPAFATHRQLSTVWQQLQQRMERLATGYRIVRAAHDAAGLAISERMRAQIRGFEQTIRNVQDLISREQVAEGGLASTQEAIQRMRELAVQATNATLTPEDRALLQEEVNQLLEQIDFTAQTTQFNTQLVIEDVTTENLRIADINLVNAPEEAIEALDQALTQVSERRANVGAMVNRYTHEMQGLMVAQENIMAAESRIRDADIAFEVMHLTRLRILQEAGVSMLAQANVAPALLTRLLG
jgi:flagellin